MASLFTPEHRAAWEDDGWCVIEGALSDDVLARAQTAIGHLFPTADEMDGAGDEERTTHWRDWDSAWPEFPYRSRTLNAITVDDDLLDTAEDVLGPGVRIYMSNITAKYANQPSGFNQLLHVDYPNHSLVVPRTDPGYRQFELFVYLTDVGPDNGATRFVPRRYTADVPVGRHTLNLTDYADLYDVPGDGSGPAGSIVAYRPDVFHRSVDWTEPGRWRVMFHISYRCAGAEWAGYQSWPFKGLRPEWYAFVPTATPRQLSALGFPAPGHPYWTPETLDGVADRYPGLDLAPWRAAASL